MSSPKDLITLARAQQSNLSYTAGSYDAQVSALITAVSDAIGKYCRRRFVSQAWD